MYRGYFSAANCQPKFLRYLEFFLQYFKCSCLYSLVSYGTPSDVMQNIQFSRYVVGKRCSDLWTVVVKA
jgi:hypothetical protein